MCVCVCVCVWLGVNAVPFPYVCISCNLFCFFWCACSFQTACQHHHRCFLLCTLFGCSLHCSEPQFLECACTGPHVRDPCNRNRGSLLCPSRVGWSRRGEECNPRFSCFGETKIIRFNHCHARLPPPQRSSSCPLVLKGSDAPVHSSQEIAAIYFCECIFRTCQSCQRFSLPV